MCEERSGSCLPDGMKLEIKAGADAVCENIRQALQKEQIAVTVLDNVLYDAEAMEKLEQEKGGRLRASEEETLK